MNGALKRATKYPLNPRQVGADDEALLLGIRAGNLARGGVDRDSTGRVCDFGRVGRAHHRRACFEEHVGCRGTREGELESRRGRLRCECQQRRRSVSEEERSRVLRTGAPLCKDGASFDRINCMRTW